MMLLAAKPPDPSKWIIRSGPRNLDSGFSEISIVFQAAVSKLVASKGIVRLIRLDPKNLPSRTLRLQVDATRPGRRLGRV